MIVKRVEKHILKQSNPYFSMIDDFCFKSKNLYNHANYIVRHEFIKNDKWVRCRDLDKILKQDVEYNDYRQMPTAQSAQQTLKQLDNNGNHSSKALKIGRKVKANTQADPNCLDTKTKTDASF